jgi:serine/threonine protein kinase/Tol biopolymer transport system component
LPAGAASSFLEHVCADDYAQRREVEVLLAAHEQADSFIEQPALDVDAELLAHHPMSLATGSRLGPYEIQTLLGAGGMGEVYRALDTRLDRIVAIKVLRSHFSQDKERKRRLEREARAVSSLNHPHICTLHDIGRQDDIDFLVMEYLVGETLAQRLKKGPLPVDEMLRFTMEITDALDKAHRQGVIHRDLKPSNIMLTKTGTKLLDFGLAKRQKQDLPVAQSGISDEMTNTATLTARGTILGTLQYMAPEQLEGKEADARTDIFALGAVIYEMATGKKAFEGESPARLMSAILDREPASVSRLRPEIPAMLDSVIHACLEKDPDERWQNARDLTKQLKWIDEGILVSQAPAQAKARFPGRERLASLMSVILSALAVGIVVGAVTTSLWMPRPELSRTQTPGPLIRTVIDLPSSAALALARSGTVALSPDGRRLAYLGQSASGTMVYLRDVGGFTVTPVAGTEGAIDAFFSPDSRWLGFLTTDKVKKVSFDGGAPVTLCNASAPARASWTRDNAIYFDENPGAAGQISRVAASGGTPTLAVPASGEARRTFNQMLPDGRAALVTLSARSISADYADVILVSLATGESKVLIPSGYDARYVPPGYLFFGRGGDLFAVRFDASRGEVTGQPVLVVSRTRTASVSDNGLLAYVPGGDRALGRLAWVDRDGRTEFLSAPARVYGIVDLSPNGKRLAVHVADVTDYIWVYDLTRGEGRRLPSNERSGWPIWSPDGTTLAFTAWQSLERVRVLARAVEGSGPVQELVPVSTGTIRPSSWSQDGRVLALDLPERGLGFGFFTFGGSLERVQNKLFQQDGAHFSPDGRWVAYTSTEGGQGDVFVRSYPNGTTVRQISVDGGREPVWCPCGELFYRSGNRWMSVKIRTQTELQWDPPTVAFETDFIDTAGRSYDVSPDGQRLLVVKRAETDILNRINFIANWTEEFRPRGQ